MKCEACGHVSTDFEDRIAARVKELGPDGLRVKLDKVSGDARRFGIRVETILNQRDLDWFFSDEM